MLDDATSRGEPGLEMKLAWNARMRSEYTGANASALLALPNYAQWIGEGDEHCVVPYNRFWWERANDEWSSGTPSVSGGESIGAWVSQLVDGSAAFSGSADCRASSAGDAACRVGLEV